MKTSIACLLLTATVLAPPAFAQSGSRNAARDQGKAVYQDQSKSYQTRTGARIHYNGIEPDPPASGLFTPEQQRIIDRISRHDRFAQ